ncbi:MAG: PQQ-binding-like beta-propeller repeat protein [Propionibacteriaceae bacterium]|nr:PQQ-binding-like beta-propeller repeat protein [Propionibacteriaceae bacterium]
MMICPRCGALYQNAAFCANDGTHLVPQAPATQATVPWPGQVPPPPPPQTAWSANDNTLLMPPPTASQPTAQAATPWPGQVPPPPPPQAISGAAPATAWPAAPPRPKRSHTALVVAIVLVMAVAAAGLFAARDKLGILGGLKVTGTAPSYTEDWTRGVTASWSQQFDLKYDYDRAVVLTQSPQVWVVGEYPNVDDEEPAIDGLDPSTGQILWRHAFDSYYWTECADALVNGKVACLEPDQSNSSQLCLIDAHTGQQSCVDLAEVVTLPSGNSGEWDSIWVSGDSLVVAGGVWTDYNEFYYWEVARLSLPSLKVDWAKAYNQTCDSGSEPAPRQLDMSGITGNVLWFSGPNDEGPGGLAVDVRNGEPLFAQCNVVYPLADGTFVAAPTVPAGPMTLPGGGSITIVNSGNAIEYTSGQFPSQPVYYVPSGGSGPYWDDFTDGTLGLGGTAWPVTLPLQQVLAGSGGQFLTGAASGDTLVVAGDAGQIVAVDYTTGQTVWSATVPVVDYGYGYTSLNVAIIGNLVIVTPTWSQDGELVTLLSLANGQTVSQMPGQAFVSPDTGMLGVSSGTGSRATVARYVPVSESWKQPPPDAPACPAGMTPVSWTKYADGSVLVCSGGSKYSVVSSQGWKAAKLQWDTDGYTITFSNGTVLNAWLGGAFVTVTKGGATTYVASESWMVSSGSATFQNTPSGITGCPSGTWPISLSTWNGGWLLVCGTAADAPTSLAYSDGTNQGRGSPVTMVGNGYCADGPSGQVCAYSAPAMVSINGVQHSVDNNFFSGSGAGGVGQGTGSYGVPAPDATAQAQVQYLVNILNSSATTRASLASPSHDVQTCQNLPDAVAQIQVVAQNRADLMTALDSAPVDHIPNGDQLVAQLRAALQASYNADEAYAAWGQMQQTSCSVQPPQNVTDTNLTAGATKDTFCATWNSQIAPTYGVPTFTTEQI